MDTPRLLFVTGPARSGSTLLAMMLSAHPAIQVASDPCFPLFRSLRNALVRDCDDPLLRSFDPSSALQDFYFSDERLAQLDAVLGGSLDTPVDAGEWPGLLDALRTRGGIMCPDLAVHFDRLMAPTYRGVWDNLLRLVAECRGERPWVGFKEVWTVEFLPAFARAFPDSRFLILLRDPRAVVASMLTLRDDDDSQGAHVPSYLRHLRKYYALALHFASDPQLAGRTRTLTYEGLLRDPGGEARDVCRFLGVPFDAAMLDPANYLDHATGDVWKGNSSYQKALNGIRPAQAERWRGKLDQAVLRLVDLVCGPEMGQWGYEPAAASAVGPEVLGCLLRLNAGAFSWRCDFDDPQRDLGYELFRRMLLASSEPPPDARLVRRSFLFEDVYARLRRPSAAAAAS